jgi:TonB family protein
VKRKFLTFAICFSLFLAVAQNSTSQTSSSIIESPTQKNDNEKNSADRPLKIIKWFTPTLFECRKSSGTTVLKITFHRSSVITDVEIIKSSNCESFDNAAIKAAKKTKFEPAAKDNTPITIIQSRQYNFVTK